MELTHKAIGPHLSDSVRDRVVRRIFDADVYYQRLGATSWLEILILANIVYVSYAIIFWAVPDK